MGGFVQLPADSFLVAFEFDLQVFAHVHGFDAAISHLFERGLDGFALGIHDGFLGGDDDFCFHFAHRDCGKFILAKREYFGTGRKPLRKLY